MLLVEVSNGRTFSWKNILIILTCGLYIVAVYLLLAVAWSDIGHVKFAMLVYIHSSQFFFSHSLLSVSVKFK